MRYDILKDFKGSQDGRFTEQFTAGTQAELSDYLAACIDPAWARPVGSGAPAQIDNKAVASDGTGGPAVFRRGKPK